MSNNRLPETTSWIQSSLLSRRQTLVSGAIASGFALAVQPVAASTLHTDNTGLLEAMVSVPTADGTIPAYRAKPDGIKNPPVIIIIHEIFGLHEWLRDVVRRFAKAGYYTIAPDLYARFGDATKITDIDTLFKTIVSKTTDEQVAKDIDATIATIAKDGGDTKRMGITGFCWGGRTVWMTAANNVQMKAGVAWYGRLTGDTSHDHPTHPVDIAGHLKAPVLGLYGALDKGIPQKDVEKMRTALAAAKSKSKLVVFPTAEHGFLADYRPSYNESAARDGWTQCLEWFSQNLK